MPFCLSFARPSRRTGVAGGACEVKARTNNRAWPASAVPPQKKKAGQDRASTVGCVKADLNLPQSKAEQIENNQQGRTKGMTGAEVLGRVMGRLAGLLFRPHNPPRTAHRFNR